MPAHRSPSTTRSHTHGPYKPPIIVISSDEEADPRPAPKRGSRRPRRSKPEEVLEILDTPVKHEDTETENLRQLCCDLEQERDMLQKDNRRLTATIDQLKASTKENTLSVSALDDAICCEVCTHTMWSPYLYAFLCTPTPTPVN
ncbi:hypothetical protein BJV78DRAFT_1238824 [Lactifluus subvellereus]|nr:hypothetical protein BJV78DRAFT_1238824 [Lactifluus subvellereus]